MGEAMSPDYYQLLQEVQTVDFVLVELNLYLDTHPEDKQALAQFNKFKQRKKVVCQQYESQFGPLHNYGDSPVGSEWSWAEGPWPWQV
jgi:spore coat protein JB